MPEGLLPDETQVYSSAMLQCSTHCTLQQPFEEALDSVAIAPRLHKDVQHNAILIDSSPEIMLDTLDWNEHLVAYLRAGGRRRRRQSAKFAPNFSHQARIVSQVISTPRSASIRSTSRGLKLDTWYSQVAGPMISAGNR